MSFPKAPRASALLALLGVVSITSNIVIAQSEAPLPPIIAADTFEIDETSEPG